MESILGTKFEVNPVTVAPVVVALIFLERIWAYYTNLKVRCLTLFYLDMK